MEIFHDPKSQKFYCIVEGKVCYAQYHLKDNTMDFFHTYTPPELRGRGIATKIFDEIKDFVEKNNIKVKASCSFAENYFKLLRP